MDLYFTEGADLTDREVLVQAAADVGLDAEDVRAALASDQDVAEIERRRSRPRKPASRACPASSSAASSRSRARSRRNISPRRSTAWRRPARRGGVDDASTSVHSRRERVRSTSAARPKTSTSGASSATPAGVTTISYPTFASRKPTSAERTACTAATDRSRFRTRATSIRWRSPMSKPRNSAAFRATTTSTARRRKALAFTRQRPAMACAARRRRLI